MKTAILIAAFLLGLLAVEALGDQWPPAFEWPVAKAQTWPVAMTWPAPRCPNGQCGAATGPQTDSGSARSVAPAAAHTTYQTRIRGRVFRLRAR